MGPIAFSQRRDLTTKKKNHKKSFEVSGAMCLHPYLDVRTLNFCVARERVCVCLITNRGNSCAEYSPKSVCYTSRLEAINVATKRISRFPSESSKTMRFLPDVVGEVFCFFCGGFIFKVLCFSNFCKNSGENPKLE